MMTGCSDTVHDNVGLEDGFRVVDAKTAQGGNDLHAFFPAIFGQKPPRRFREPDHENADDKAENDLEGNGKTPGQAWRSICASKIKPICDKTTESNDAAFNANE